MDKGTRRTEVGLLNSLGLALVGLLLRPHLGEDGDSELEVAGDPMNWSEADMGEVLRVLAEAVLETDAAEVTGAGYYERSTARRCYRNGIRVRERLATPLGIARNVRVPKLRGGRLRLPWLRGKLSEVASLRELSSRLFARGMSVDGIAQVSELLFGAPLSKSTASRFNDALQERYDAWLNTSIDADVRYLFLDGIRLKVRRGTDLCVEGVLAAMGITRTGERVMLGFVWGPWESTESWTTLLRHLTRRGLDPGTLEMVTVDGNPGLFRALANEWPSLPVQRCWEHKRRNIMGTAKKSTVKELMRDLAQVREACTQRQADEARDAFVARWQDEEPKAVELLLKDWDKMFTFLRAPSRYWKTVRNTNILERAFQEFRRKFKNVRVMPTQPSAERLAFAQIEILNRRWAGKRLPRW